MKFSLLKRLTIIIPTYNRQDYALRAMRYWSGRGPLVYVVDGSEAPIDDSEITLFESNISYIHRPTGVADRLSFVTKLIDTDYVTMLPDDEFFLPAALADAIQFLQDQSDYSACIGQTLLFGFDKEGVTGKEVYRGENRVDLTQATSAERLLSLFGNYMPATILGVVRSDVWRMALALFEDKEFSVYAIGEIEFELCVVFAGKVEVLSELMRLRSSENPPIRGTDPTLMHKNQFRSWWVSEEEHAERNEFINIVVTRLFSWAEKSRWDYSESDIKELVSEIFDLYASDQQKKFDLHQSKVQARLAQVESRQKTKLQKKATNKNKNSKEKAGKFLSGWVRRFVNLLLKPANQPANQPKSISLIQSAKNLSENGAGVNFVELEEIASIVTRFHESAAG